MNASGPAFLRPTAVVLPKGWVTEVIVDRSTGNVVDGHLRIELALARDEATVPVHVRRPDPR